MSSSILKNVLRGVHDNINRFDSFFNNHLWLRRAFVGVGIILSYLRCFILIKSISQ